jgi:hypothetical protein
MVFNIVFSSTFKIDTDEIKYVLNSETFNEFFEDIAEVNSAIVKRIATCDEALKFIVKKLDDDKYKSQDLADDATPENAFNEMLTNLIDDNIDAIMYALEKEEEEEEDEEDEEEDPKMSKVIQTELNGRMVYIVVSEKDGILDACIKDVY